MSSIQVTITFDSPAAAIDGLSRLHGANVVPPAVVAGKPAATAAGAASSPPASPAAPTPSPAASATPATSQAQKPAPSPKPAAAPAPAPTPAAEPQVTYPTSGIPELIQTAQKAGKVPEIKALLAKFGVAKGPELKADQLAAFKAEMEALAGQEDLG